MRIIKEADIRKTKSWTQPGYYLQKKDMKIQALPTL